MKLIKILTLVLSLTIYGDAISQVNYFDNAKEIYFQFELESTDEINALSRIISIDNVIDGRIVKAYANAKEFNAFLEQGIEYTVLQHPGTLIRNPRMLDQVNIREITEWDFYPTYDAYLDMMEQFVNDYPDLCEIHHIGYTYEEREIIAVKISDNVGEEENEPEFFYTSTMHGDETTGYVLMLRFIDYLLSNYGDDPRITNMVNEIEIYINPLANPDGTYASGNNSVYGATRYNAHLVDLNRNFPDPEDGPHPDGNPWQIETMAFMDFAEEHNLVMSANIHGGAEVCNYPWDTWPRLAADDDWWVFVCREYADTVHANSIGTNYMTGFNNGITNGYAWYTIAGGRQDYHTYFHQGREFTLEISNTKLLPASQLPAHWDYNYRSFLNYLEQVLYGVRGIITDDSSGDPIKAEVYILNHEEDSSWVYSHLAPGNYHRVIYEGTYDIRYSAPGYFPQVFEDLEVDNYSTVVLNVQLVPQFSGFAEQTFSSVKVFPNPVSSNYFQLTSTLGIEKVRVIDISGKLVLEQEFADEERVFINVSHLPSNIYAVQVYTGGDVKTMKVKIL
ncbi:MAG: M14 family zinc carboxypeptidase [Bacteroidota bacterium]|nr:M14 family zinc carboxypeptidase [Bacteroidota bacterium]